jgi:hypothetical protein
MSALPPGEMTPGPQMMSVGFSLAGMALADTRKTLAEALRRFDEAATAVRNIFDASPGASERFDLELTAAGTAKLRQWLDYAFGLESGFAQARESLATMLANWRFKTALNKYRLTGYAKVTRFQKELVEQFIPAIRETRLRIICTIAERASGAGVHVLDASEDFRKEFTRATLKETEGWQETAYILANIDGARSLSESIKSAALDRTEEFLSVPAKRLGSR